MSKSVWIFIVTNLHLLIWNLLIVRHKNNILNQMSLKGGPIFAMIPPMRGKTSSNSPPNSRKRSHTHTEALVTHTVADSSIFCLLWKQQDLFVFWFIWFSIKCSNLLAYNLYVLAIDNPNMLCNRDQIRLQITTESFNNWLIFSRWHWSDMLLEYPDILMQCFSPLVISWWAFSSGAFLRANHICE